MVELSEESRFQDGREVEATDAVRSLRRFLRSRAPSAALLAELLDGGRAFASAETDALPGLDTAGEHAVVLRLSQPSSQLPADLASPSATIVGIDGVGAGPFRSLHAVRDERIRLVAFGSHVRGRPLLDEIELRRYADVSSLGRAFEEGHLDVVLGSAASRPPSLVQLLLVLESAAGPFTSLAERLRVNGALDRATLAERFIPGGGPSCGLLPPNDFPSTSSCSRTTLGESGPRSAAARRAVRLVVDASVSPAASRRVVAHFLSLGFDPDVRVTLPDAPQLEADARLLLWTPEGPDAVAALVEAAALAGRGEEMARRLAPLRVETSGDRIRSALEGAERDLLERSLLVPLAVVPDLAVRPRVRGLERAPFGSLLLEDAWVPL